MRRSDSGIPIVALLRVPLALPVSCRVNILKLFWLLNLGSVFVAITVEKK